MNDNPYFTLGPEVNPSQFVPPPLEPNELFRGDYWSIFLEDGAYVLGFLSGELAGRFKRVTISRRRRSVDEGRGFVRECVEETWCGLKLGFDARATLASGPRL